jgi:hypothetical protein
MQRKNKKFPEQPFVIRPFVVNPLIMNMYGLLSLFQVLANFILVIQSSPDFNHFF